MVMLPPLTSTGGGITFEGKCQRGTGATAGQSWIGVVLLAHLLYTTAASEEAAPTATHRRHLSELTSATQGVGWAGYNDIVFALYGSDISVHWYKKAVDSWLGNSHETAFFVTETLTEFEHDLQTYPTVPILGTKAYTDVKWGRMNNDGDNKPMELIAMVNQSGPQFDWLAVGDDDTCFNVPKVRALLADLDPAVPAIVGNCDPVWSRYDAYLMKAQIREKLKPTGAKLIPFRDTVCCVGRAVSNEMCKPKLFSLNVGLSFEGLRDDERWPHGGDGYLLSRGLLDLITPEQWRFCQTNYTRWGGDVRVAKCIRHWTGVVMTQYPSQELSGHKADLWGRCTAEGSPRPAPAGAGAGARSAPAAAPRPQGARSAPAAAQRPQKPGSASAAAAARRPTPGGPSRAAAPRLPSTKKLIGAGQRGQAVLEQSMARMMNMRKRAGLGPLRTSPKFYPQGARKAIEKDLAG